LTKQIHNLTQTKLNNMFKPSPLKHREDGHGPLSEVAHKEAHGGEIPEVEETSTKNEFEDGFEHITNDEFDIGNIKNYGVEGSGYDDVEGNLVKKLKEKYPKDEFGFDFSEAIPGTDAIEVTNPDGTPTIIKLNSSWNSSNKDGSPRNPDAYKQLMAALNSNVDPEKKKVFDKTGLNPNDDGNYDVEIALKEDIEEFDIAKEEAGVGNWGGLVKRKDPITKTDLVLDVAADMEGELTKALTSVSKEGQYSNYPGLEKYTSELQNLQSLTPGHQKKIREAVFKEVNANGDYKISKNSFNDIWDRKLWSNVTNKLSSDFQKENNTKLKLSKDTVDPDIIKHEENSRHAKLKGARSEKQKEVAKITAEEENIKNFKSQIEELSQDPKKNEGKIASLNQQIEQSNFNIKEHFKQIDNIATTTKYTPKGKDGLTVDKTTEKDNELASTLYDYSGMSEERAKRIKAAADDQKITVDPELAAIKTANPKLTDKEAMKELWELKVLQKQQLAKDSRDKFITIDPSEFFGLPTSKADKEFIKFMRTAKENGLTGKDGKIKMSLYDFMTKFEQDHRDFNNWYDAGSGVISEEDLALIEETETVRDQNAGQMDAIYEMYFMNTDPGEIDKGNLVKTFVQAGAEAIGREWLGMSEREAQNMATLGDGPRAQIMMDKMNDVQHDINQQIADGVIDGEPLVWTKDQMLNMERTFGEEVAEGVGNFVPMLVELGVVSAASGGVGSVTGLTQVMGALRAGKHGRKGKMAYHALMAGWEEAKMQAIFELPPTGGAMFYAGGAATQRITPFKAGGRFSWLDPVFQKVFKGGVIGATSAEAAHITEMAYDDLMGHKDFKAKFDENFGDMDANLRRYAVNAIVFGLTGVTHLKKGDFKSSNQKIGYISDIQKMRSEILENPEGATKYSVEGKKVLGPTPIEGKPEGYENLSLKQQEKYDNLGEIADLMSQQYQRETYNKKLDPKAENAEANFNEVLAEPFNRSMRGVIPDYKGIKIKLDGNKKGWRNKDATAEYQVESNTMLIDPAQYTPGKPIHEFTHAALRAMFQKNPQLKINFVESLSEKFGEFDFSTKRGQPLGDAILEHYGRASGPEGKDMRKKEGKTKKNEEFLAYMFEMLADPVIYNQKVAPTFFKEAKQEVSSIMQEYLGYTPQMKTAADFVNFIGGISKDASAGLPFGKRMSRFAGKDLQMNDFLGIEYSVAREKRQNEALGSRNLELEKQVLLKKPKTKETEKKIAEIDNLIEKSKVNQKFTDKYKQAKAREVEAAESKIRVEKRQEELDKVKASHDKGLTVEGKELSKDKITRDYQIEQDVNKVEAQFKIPTTASSNALAVLRENNKGILTNYVNDFYRDVSGSTLTQKQFKNHVENVEFERILGTYNRRAESLKDVPFNYYLESVLRGAPGFGGG